MGRRAQRRRDKADATRPVARNSPPGDSAKVRNLETRLADALDQLQTSNRQRTEAHEQQAAAAEILRVISSSPANLQPVFETVISSAIRLAGGNYYGGISLLHDDVFHLAASQGPALATIQRNYPLRLDQSGLMNTAVTTRAPAHTANVFDDPRVGPFARQMASAAGYHA